MSNISSHTVSVSAIVPARNEEAVISACVESLVPQSQIAEILVVDDQSSDRTAQIVRSLSLRFPKVKLLETAELPAGWMGKNNAVWIGAQAAQGEWLLFTDADAVHEPNSATKALALAREHHAAMVSFSPEQVMETWYEKAVIPYVYSRLAARFRFADVNDPNSSAAAANGQFILIRRDAYDAVGGHASIARDLLEDVALAARVKASGYRLWFGTGKGIVRVRMYRSFAAIWEGWKKNLYSLMGGSPSSVWAELAGALLPILVVLMATIAVWWTSGSTVLAAVGLWVGLSTVLAADGWRLKSGGFPPRLLGYSIAARILFSAMLWGSYRSHRNGRLEWKGRAYPVDTPRASKG
jgi:cellulose synthase/poly-beta-1,6-N-acetylglucosamine synthase-like glycosyltransferase